MDVVIGLGSNLGEPLRQLAIAVQRIAELARVTGISALYRTAPVGPPQPEYLNAAVRAETPVKPLELLARLHDLERRAGRLRRERWGPRVLDLDVLWIRAAGIAEPQLVVPHPELERRAFALVPLLDVAPGATHPEDGRAYGEILRLVPSAGVLPAPSADWPPALPRAPRD